MTKHCLYCLFLALFSFPLCAQWTRLDQPAIHSIQEVVGNRDTLAIKTGILQPHLYVSYDRGENWKDISNPAYNNHTLFDVKNGKIFAFDLVKGIAVYENGQWFTRNNGLQQNNATWGYLVFSLDIHPDWVLISNLIGHLNWLYLSKDDGLTWVPVSGRGLNNGYQALYGKFVGDRIYSWGLNAIQDGKPEAYYSDNFGKSWNSLPVSAPAGDRDALIVKANHVFVRQDGNWYLHKGNTLVKTVNLPSIRDPEFVVLESEGRLLCATDQAIFRSDDDGINWSQALKAPIGSLREIVKYGAQLMAIDNGQFFVSNDNGDTWQNQSMPYKFTKFFSNSGQLYGASRGQEGFYCFDPALQQWKPKNKGIQKISESFTHLVSEGSKAWAFSPLLNCAFFSEDAGQTWQEIDRHINNVTSKVNGQYYGHDWSLVITSTDGKNWNTAPSLTRPLRDIYYLFSNKNNLFAVTYTELLLRSVGGTAPWDTINTNMSSISRVITNDSIWHLATSYSIHRSEDEGKTLNQISTFVNSTSLLWSDNRILTSLHDGGIRYLDTASSIWKTGSGTASIKFNFSNGNNLTAVDKVLIAAAQGGKILTSTNNGENWTLFNEGLTTSTNCNETIAIGDRLYAACDDGMWARPLSDLPVVTPTTEPPVVNLYTPVPNPTTGLLQFQNVPTGTALDVRVCDSNGRTVFAGDIAQTNYTLDLSGQPQGVYFIRLFDGKSVGVSRVVVR